MTPEERKAKKAAYYQANREKILAKVKAYADANPEKVKAVNKRWRDENAIEYDRARYARDPKKYNARSRKYYHGNHEAQRAVAAQRYQETKKWVYARTCVKVAVARGELEKYPCWVCGDVNTEAHHADYDAPLSVVWLCRSHHQRLHHEV